MRRGRSVREHNRRYWEKWVSGGLLASEEGRRRTEAEWRKLYARHLRGEIGPPEEEHLRREARLGIGCPLSDVRSAFWRPDQIVDHELGFDAMLGSTMAETPQEMEP